MIVHLMSVDRHLVELKDLSLLVGQGSMAGAWINAPESKTSRAFPNSNASASLGCKT